MNLPGDLNPVHTGHGKIKYRQIDICVPVWEVERGTAAADFQGCITRSAQHSRVDLPHGLIIVNQKNNCTLDGTSDYSDGIGRWFRHFIFCRTSR